MWPHRINPRVWADPQPEVSGPSLVLQQYAEAAAYLGEDQMRPPRARSLSTFNKRREGVRSPTPPITPLGEEGVPSEQRAFHRGEHLVQEYSEGVSSLIERWREEVRREEEIQDPDVLRPSVQLNDVRRRLANRIGREAQQLRRKLQRQHEKERYRRARSLTERKEERRKSREEKEEQQMQIALQRSLEDAQMVGGDSMATSSSAPPPAPSSSSLPCPSALPSQIVAPVAAAAQAAPESDDNAPTPIASESGDDDDDVHPSLAGDLVEPPGGGHLMHRSCINVPPIRDGYPEGPFERTQAQFMAARREEEDRAIKDVRSMERDPELRNRVRDFIQGDVDVSDWSEQHTSRMTELREAYIRRWGRPGERVTVKPRSSYHMHAPMTGGDMQGGTLQTRDRPLEGDSRMRTWQSSRDRLARSSPRVEVAAAQSGLSILMGGRPLWGGEDAIQTASTHALQEAFQQQQQQQQKKRQSSPACPIRVVTENMRGVPPILRPNPPASRNLRRRIYDDVMNLPANSTQLLAELNRMEQLAGRLGRSLTGEPMDQDDPESDPDRGFGQVGERERVSRWSWDPPPDTAGQLRARGLVSVGRDYAPGMRPDFSVVAPDGTVMEGKYGGNPKRGVSDLEAFHRGFLSRIRAVCYPPRDGKPRENTQFALVLRGRGVDRVTRTCTVEEREPTGLERREWDYLEDLRANATHRAVQDMTIRPHLPVHELLSPQRVYVEEDITPPAGSFDQRRGRDRRGYRVKCLKEQESSTLWFGVDLACFYNLITYALFQVADAVGAIVWK
uniref:Uncharacterized protein n=1 Tax=Chromera velia CCMP2878 TaxID=1169474 RepID=A0A0G4HFV8_9ALVE|eukprot:Cvel_27198.t1-p1 / transcript=Cvel_27198.t1 / gene=Cvel_27198 / organism=Chromera_velia_CCMP2878 / gene_product=hypothetical protein / transcript_product=hypothetical protein / location=Cvel_scaffold3358:9870-12347(-) / protein_length=787 / sequence_SO=supercontig / SO=protein_coding / is_pseudo=false